MDKKRIKTFGEHIKTLRTSLGFPQRKIAAQLDIDPSLLGKFERNERLPSRLQIKKLAEIFMQDENKLFEEYLSDQIAYKILEEQADINILKIAAEKIIYLKRRKDA